MGATLLCIREKTSTPLILSQFASVLVQLTPPTVTPTEKVVEVGSKLPVSPVIEMDGAHASSKSTVVLCVCIYICIYVCMYMHICKYKLCASHLC